jgi:hypothetical protein
MFIVLGLVILIAAVVVGLAGVLTNHGSAHVLTHRFDVFGYQSTAPPVGCSSTESLSERWPCSG